MLSRSRLPAVGLPAVLLALLAGGCQGNKPSAETQARLTQDSVVSAERDRLVQDMADNARLMSEIGAELAKVQVPRKALHVSSESPLRASHDSVIQKIHYIAAKVRESDARLHESEARIASLTQISDSLRNTLESTLTNYQSMLETQRATIASMTEQLNQLAAQNAALSDTVNVLAAATNKVYYIIGTEDELIQRGIIQKEGGSRFPLLFAKLGQTIVPARHLDPSAFLVLNNKRENRQITLPDSTHTYRIGSLQDLNALESPPPDGKITGGVIRIADPDRFWSASKFLIIVEG